MNQEEKNTVECRDDTDNTQENAPVNQFEQEAIKAKEATDKLKKTILIIAAGMVVFVIVALILMPILDRAINGTEREEATTVRFNTVIYFDPDYDYDIMQDQEYLQLDRYIYYKDARTGETIIIPEDEIKDYGPAMVTLTDMLHAIIMGDHEAYNALFSSNYFAVEGREPEQPFTMQQVYDILITRIEVNDMVSDEFGRYTQYEYTVEYKIHKNNGTFRTDLGHDDSRKQYFVLSDSTGKDVLIDQILGYNYKN